MLSQLCLTPWTVAHQAPLYVGFSRQESWSGLSSSPGDVLHPGIERASPALTDSFFYHCTLLGSLRIDFTSSLCTVSHDDPIDFHSISCFWSYCSSLSTSLSFLFHHQGGNPCRLTHQDYNPPFPYDKHGGSLNFSLL